MSSLRGVRRRACSRKIKYKTEAEATRAARTVSGRTGEWFRAYRCSFCGAWHVGHPPSDIQRKLLDRLVGRSD